MASIYAQVKKSGTYYFLREGRGIKDISLGTKPPWPKSRGWDNLSQERIDWLKERHIQKRASMKKLMKPQPTQNGKYRTIVIDPPWPMQRIGREMVVGEEMVFDYPTMTITQIKNDRKLVPIRKLSDKSGCFIFLWTTQKHLPQSYSILEAWGFTYLFTMVWDKGHGMKPFNLPLFNCEFLITGKRGKIDFLDTRGFKTLFNGDRRNHSQKPAEFYKTLTRITPAPRIDIFSREKHKGFDQLGNETGKF